MEKLKFIILNLEKKQREYSETVRKRDIGKYCLR